jgi:hypothetical protein
VPVNGSLASLALRTTGCPVGQAMDAYGVCQWVYDPVEIQLDDQFPNDVELPDDVWLPDDVLPPPGIIPPTPDNPIIDLPPVKDVPPVVPPVVVPPVVVPPVVAPEDLGSPWYMQVIKPQIPREPWMVLSTYGIMPSTDLPNTSSGRTSDFYAYTGPRSGIPEEVSYDLFYGGDRWNKPQDLLDAIEASLYKEDVEAGVTTLEWPGMESWLTSSGIPEEDWNSSLYQGSRYNSAHPYNFHYAEPRSISYPWSYDVDIGFGDLTSHFRPDGRNFKWGD